MYISASNINKCDNYEIPILINTTCSAVLYAFVYYLVQLDEDIIKSRNKQLLLDCI